MQHLDSLFVSDKADRCVYAIILLVLSTDAELNLMMAENVWALACFVCTLKIERVRCSVW